MLLEGLERTDVSVYSVLGMSPYGAGVEKHKIGVVDLVAKFKAHALEYSFNALAVADILLTAVDLYKRLRRPAESGEKQFAVFFAKLPLTFGFVGTDTEITVVLQRRHIKIPLKA